MGESLTGKTPKNTYKWLAHFGEDGPLDAETPRTLTMGDGSDTPLSMTLTKLFMDGSEVETVEGAQEKADAAEAAAAANAASQITAERSATATLANKTLTDPVITGYTEAPVAIGNSGSSKTISLASGTAQNVTLDANCTFTLPTPTNGDGFRLQVFTGAGGFSPVFTGAKWPDNVTPSWEVTAGRYYFVSFLADGTRWSGTVSATYTP